MLRSKFVIEQNTPEFMYIIDTGIVHKSVTNDVVAVLSFLSENHELENRRLFYKDTHGRIDEILHQNGTFKGFSLGHAGIEILEK